MVTNRQLAVLLIGAILAGACLAVWSQTTSIDPCTGATLNQPPTPPTNLEQPLVCERETGRTYDFNTKGAIAWSYCYQPATNKYTYRFVVAPWSDLQNVPNMAKDVYALGMSATNEQIRQMLLKYRSGSITDAAYAAVWCPFKAQMIAGIPAPPPAAPLWVTDRITTYQSNGRSVLPPLGRTSVGVPCDCQKPLVIGTVTYCTPQGASAPTVASCVKR